MKSAHSAGDCRTSPTGFSLMEILVAVAVFTLLLTLLIHILGGVVRATTVSQRQLEAREEIQAVLGTFEQDFGNAVTQFGVPIFGGRAPDGNGRLAFLTRSRGPSGVTNTRFLAVDFQRRPDGSFVRSTAPVVWTEMGLKEVAVQNLSPSNESRLAGNIVRFQAVAELADGRVVELDSPEAGTTTLSDGSPVPPPFRRLGSGTGTNTVRAITVSVAALDVRSRELLEQEGGMAALVEVLDSGTGRTPLDRWSHVVQTGGLASFPQPVRETLQFAERTYSSWQP